MDDRLRRVSAGLILWGLLGACVPPETEERDFGEESPMLAIQKQGTMTIAVPANAPPYAFAEDEIQGFAVDIGRLVADDLGVDAEFLMVDDEEMPDLVGGPDPIVDGDGRVDLAVTTLPITSNLYKIRSRNKGIEVSTPYFITHQRLLAPENSSVTNVTDLAGKKVCSLADDETGVRLDSIEPDVEIVDVTLVEECVALLTRGAADAATATEDKLYDIQMLLDQQPRTEPFKIVGDQLTTVAFGLLADRGMGSYVSSVINEAKSEGRWAEIYDEWIAPLSERPAEPPELTLYDAASLFPLEN
ncbi:MAG: transporter substrate-binding domain-containing protein [Actinomycetota bacterium]|nr:transporter substrate-binding domain-containing protein [Actinomycetota bacterium]